VRDGLLREPRQESRVERPPVASRAGLDPQQRVHTPSFAYLVPRHADRPLGVAAHQVGKGVVG